MTKKELQNKLSSINTAYDLKKFFDIIVLDKYGIKNPILASGITYYAFHNPKKYRTFSIPKKSGGNRVILAPKKILKEIQSLLNLVFSELYKKNYCAHGFVPSRSVATNAKRHIGKNYIFNMDLENFFPSITQARVWKILQLPPLSLSRQGANLIAQLLCYQSTKELDSQNFLPQGAPTSPIISNFICRNLDKQLYKLAKENGAIYTRYADDITFSSNHNLYQENSDFLNKVYEIIAKENFKIKESKTRLQKRGFKQEVTGVIVNKKLNVSRKYIKNLRALIYLVNKYGLEQADKILNKNIKNIILGKINYIKMIKGANDSTYLNLIQKAIDLKLIENNKSAKNQLLDVAHEPKKLVEVLSKFSFDDCLKYTTHSWSGNNYKSYEQFIKNVKSKWNDINKKYQCYKIDKMLWIKINNFLLSDFTQKSEEYWEYFNTKIKFGWSSQELKEWINSSENNGKLPQPLEYEIPADIASEIAANTGKEIKKFMNIAMLFKNQIEIRSDEDALLNIFSECENSHLSEFKLNIDELYSIKPQFYTNVARFKNGLEKIFECISRKKNNKEIIVHIDENSDDVVIKITHLNSIYTKKSDEMIKEISNGDFGDIFNSFISLCDWSVEAQCNDGSFRFNFLSDKQLDKGLKEQLQNKPDGFIHILRFYK